MMKWLRLCGVVGLAFAWPSTGVDLVTWEPIALGRHGTDVRALAMDPRGAVFVAGPGGIRRVLGRMPAVRVHAGDARDLATSGDTVFAAVEQGIVRIAADTAHDDLSGIAGEARAATRLAFAGGVGAAATPDGVRVRDAAGRWRRVRSLPSRPAQVVALRERGRDAFELWAGYEGALWVAGGGVRDAVEISFAQRVALPMSPGATPLAVAFAPNSEQVLLATSHALVLRSSAGRWRTLPVALPPGASVSRIAWTASGIWLATDSGLLEAQSVDGPFFRAEAPVGTLGVTALAAWAGDVVVANRQGVWRRGERGLAPSRVAPRVPMVPIHAVHAAVRRHLELDAASLMELRTRVRSRGVWPEVDVSAGYDYDRLRTRDDDQTFSSGATRDLIDVSHDRGDAFFAKLTLSWDLGDAAFHPEEIDAAREVRAWIALRDDVLDEVNQLFFERERALARASLLSPGNPERPVLESRAAELAAGLDAWTGGWFSRHASGADRSPLPR